MRMRGNSRRAWYLMPVTWLVVAAVLATAVTLMLLFGRKTKDADNTLTPGFVDVSVYESPPPPYLIDESGTVDKQVSVKNTGEVPVWIRVKLSGGGVDNFTFDPDPPDGKWSYEDDGFWYYTEKVAKNEFTVPLFDSITLKPGIGSNIDLRELDIAVYSEAVQWNTGDSWGQAIIDRFYAASE